MNIKHELILVITEVLVVVVFFLQICLIIVSFLLLVSNTLRKAFAKFLIRNLCVCVVSRNLLKMVVYGDSFSDSVKVVMRR